MMFLFKLKKGITFLYEADKINYKEVIYYVHKETLIPNPSVKFQKLKSGNFHLDCPYFNKKCEYESLDEIIAELVKFKKQKMMISAILHDDGTYDILI